LPRSIVTVLTTFAMLVSFSLAAAEPLQAASSIAAQSRGLSGETSCFLQYLAGELIVVTPADDSHTPPLPMDFQRDLSAGETESAGRNFYSSQYRISSKTGSFSIKDTILLKLRI